MTSSDYKKNILKSSKHVFDLTVSSNPRAITGIEKFLQTISKKLNIDDGTMYRGLMY